MKKVLCVLLLMLALFSMYANEYLVCKEFKLVTGGKTTGECLNNLCEKYNAEVMDIASIPRFNHETNDYDVIGIIVWFKCTEYKNYLDLKYLTSLD